MLAGGQAVRQRTGKVALRHAMGRVLPGIWVPGSCRFTPFLVGIVEELLRRYPAESCDFLPDRIAKALRALD